MGDELQPTGATLMPRDVVADVRLAIMHMAEQVDRLIEDGDWETLVRGLAPLQDVIGDLRNVERRAKQGVADTMPDRQVVVEGVGVVERRRQTTRRNWQSEDLLRRLVFAAVVDRDTGEVAVSGALDAAEVIVKELLAVVPVTGSLGWRVGALRDRGLDPGDWCEETTDGWAIKFTRRKD